MDNVFKLSNAEGGESLDANIYWYNKPFDKSKFEEAIKREFGFQKAFKDKTPAEQSFRSASLLGMIDLLIRIGNDPEIKDIRWAAYMLATAFHETGHLCIPNEESGKGHLGMRPEKLDKLFVGPPKLVDTYLRYYDPVKLHPQPDGSVLVTETDGDQWAVKPENNFRVKKAEKRGSQHTETPHATYQKAAGQELRFHGRGYVHLTWWVSYLAAGIELGEGVKFLLNPDLTLEEKWAYKIMSAGMCRGKIFTKTSFWNYFLPGTEKMNSDYKNARKMINDQDRAALIADYADKFEKALLAAKLASPVATA